MLKGEVSCREEAVVLGRELLDAGVLAHGEAMDGEEEEERGRVFGEGELCCTFRWMDRGNGYIV